MVNAAAYLVVEATSGQVLADRISGSADPASLTKLMTAYLAFDALHQKKLSLTQRLRVPERAWKTEGSRMFIGAGGSGNHRGFVARPLVQSGNDAAVALAITITQAMRGEFIIA